VAECAFTPHIHDIITKTSQRWGQKLLHGPLNVTFACGPQGCLSVKLNMYSLPVRQLCYQTTAVRLLTASLYDSIRGSTSLTNQAQNELELLLELLNATETYTSSLSECAHFTVLKKRLQSCHVVLQELQKLVSHPDTLGAQSLISEIRARLSSVIFGLSEVNLNMMMCVRDDVL
jgi:hypothetical protein